jgi:hypothetical protein
MFQFSRLALFRVIYLQYIRLSHSEICGLSLVCSYPQLIAAYHVLHRLSMPRHPPCALIRFKYCCYYFFLLHCSWYIAVSLTNFAFPICQRTSKQTLSFAYLWCVRIWTTLQALNLTSFDHYFLTTFSLIYAQELKKWRISESNRWPPACKAGALASWANPPFLKRQSTSSNCYSAALSVVMIQCFLRTFNLF